MRPPPEVHDALACLLTVSRRRWCRRCATRPGRRRSWQAACPEAAEAAGLPEAHPDLDAGELEELYTRTFDNVAERSLEVGWQLFGENYARGVLMVRLPGADARHGVPEDTELPDHLTHVLALLGAPACGRAGGRPPGLARTRVRCARPWTRSRGTN